MLWVSNSILCRNTRQTSIHLQGAKIYAVFFELQFMLPLSEHLHLRAGLKGAIECRLPRESASG